jgi:hypothetical protein
MKTSIALGLTLAASLAGVLAPSSNALAMPAVHSGSICQHWNPGEANFPIYYTDGIKNSSTTAKYVICPLVVEHTPGKTQGSVYVQVNTPVAFSCTLYSWNWNDTFLGSKAGVTSPASKLLFLGPVPANTFSSHSVLCRLPANYTGKIVGIEANF